ncbi:DUF6053 domain-containing protein [Lysobacter enzymogenes]|uniref:DUF6053 domain-containing protein n=1 Tax=Lysobacter enzymogenes TaxID=69 RepID=UPI003D2F7027
MPAVVGGTSVPMLLFRIVATWPNSVGPEGLPTKARPPRPAVVGATSVPTPFAQTAALSHNAIAGLNPRRRAPPACRSCAPAAGR